MKIHLRDFLNTIEDYPQALAAFLPSVSFSFTSSKARHKSKSQFCGVTDSTEVKNIERRIGLELTIFNGGGSVAALKYAQAGFRAARGKYYTP